MDNSIFAEFMENFAANISVLVSLVSVVSTAAVAIWNAYLNSKNERKIKKMELSYEQRLKAYSDYLKVSAEIFDVFDQGQITDLYNAAGRAMLFASRQTFVLIEEHKCAVQKALVKKIADPKGPSDDVIKAEEIRRKLLHSMQRDLSD